MKQVRQSKQDHPVAKWLICVSLLIAVVASSVAVWALFFRETQKEEPVSIRPDYELDVEANADPIPNDASEATKDPKKGGFVTLTYSDQVSIDLSDKTASLVFANPKRSNQDMVLQIVIQDHVIVQTGRLLPGNQIATVQLEEDSVAKLTAGKYEGKFVVYYYNQETGKQATVNTEIPIMVVVKN